MKIEMSLVGRIENNITLGAGKFLIPLFEAITNAIHAIDDLKEVELDLIGRIEVTIHRDTTEVQNLLDGGKALPPISGFTIEDNGIGFTKKNFDSFRTADSLYKKTRGGKGVGRFYWLKAFKTVRVESDYLEDDKWQRREFEFFLSEDPIKVKREPEATSGPRKTAIHLLDCFPQFRKEDVAIKQPETIARKIIEHFLTFFVQNTCPEILLNDPFTATEAFSLNRMFTEQLRLEDQFVAFTVSGKTFKIHKLRIRTNAQRPPHTLHLCAQGRSVEEVSLSAAIPALIGALTDTEGNRFCYAGYVSGEVLDENVSQDRSRFDLPQHKGFYSEVAIDELVTKAGEESESFLTPYLEPLREQQIEKVRKFAEDHPRYRPIVKLRPSWIHAISPDLKVEELDLQLYRLSQQLELEVRTEGAALKTEVASETADEPVQSVNARKRSLKRYLDDTNAISIAKLAEYVVQRKATLDFLSDCMSLQHDGKYATEDVIHEHLFPMKSTSDTIEDFDQNNLWIVDERLSYHMYLASDLPFSQIEALQDDSTERMDMIVLREFDVPHAFVDSERPFASVTIVELKRPMRQAYKSADDEKDPIWQVWRYVERIRGGTMKDRTQQFIRVPDATPFYAFILCTLTPQMEKLALGNDFTSTPDGQGYFHWHKHHKVYTEIISYDKMIRDARNRNQVLFDKLNLPLRRKI